MNRKANHTNVSTSCTSEILLSTATFQSSVALAVEGMKDERISQYCHVHFE